MGAYGVAAEQLAAEQDEREELRLKLIYAIDDDEKLRGKIIRGLDYFPQLLSDARHANEHGRTAVVDEFLSRAIDAIEAALLAARTRPGK